MSKPNVKINYAVLKNVEPTTQLAAALLAPEQGGGKGTAAGRKRESAFPISFSRSPRPVP